jgi:hypothetical protein
MQVVFWELNLLQSRKCNQSGGRLRTGRMRYYGLYPSGSLISLSKICCFFGSWISCKMIDGSSAHSDWPIKSYDALCFREFVMFPWGDYQALRILLLVKQNIWQLYVGRFSFLGFPELQWCFSAVTGNRTASNGSLCKGSNQMESDRMPESSLGWQCVECHCRYGGLKSLPSVPVW